jgi:hypothetical protein
MEFGLDPVQNGFALANTDMATTRDGSASSDGRSS